MNLDERIEFKKHVVFESDGFCEKCEEMEHRVFDLGLADEVDFYAAALIPLHPAHVELMAELSFQDMALPVCVFAGKAVGVEEFLRSMEIMAEEKAGRIER